MKFTGGAVFTLKTQTRVRAARKTACTCRRREAGVGRLNDAVVSRVRENFHLVTREARQVQMQECFPASSVGKSNMGKKKKKKKGAAPKGFLLESIVWGLLRSGTSSAQTAPTCWTGDHLKNMIHLRLKPRQHIITLRRARSVAL